ncbi:hypothetical protein PLICRDRAFT_434827 [Plicaturopsis crispa FD-325 SS-3]|uniref:DUF6534 domain-containing protein n=1 Tax=Plicaturopsis crispa FD-325 SS-3 TaxID=944288 RepID=A0A0C9T760_PLICR|nr:hypothetical protein PLICRDRAFT_434827 [Plicaturopsis crispa FD-325 SS-3]
MAGDTTIDDPTREQLVLIAAPYLLGTLFNGILLGCLSVQLYLYSISNSKDRVGTNLLVYTLYIIDLAQTAITVYCTWQQVIWTQGPYESMPGFLWSLSVSQLLAGVVSFITQCFFGWRIWVLKNTSLMRKLSMCIFTFAVMQFASTIALAAITLLNSYSREAVIEQGVVTMMMLIASFICDILIAGCQLHIFKQARSQTLIKKTATMLTKLVAVTVQTGFITAVAAGLQLVAFLLNGLSPNQYNIMFSFLLGKLYSNVLLATLNARTAMTRLAATEVISGMTMESGEGMVFRAAPRGISQRTMPSELVSTPEGENATSNDEPSATTKENADTDIGIHLRVHV